MSEGKKKDPLLRISRMKTIDDLINLQKRLLRMYLQNDPSLDKQKFNDCSRVINSLIQAHKTKVDTRTLASLKKLNKMMEVLEKKAKNIVVDEDDIFANLNSDLEDEEDQQ